MNRTHRAGIFSPLGALAGYDDSIAGKLVPYTDRHSLREDEKRKTGPETFHTARSHV